LVVVGEWWLVNSVSRYKVTDFVSFLCFFFCFFCFVFFLFFFFSLFFNTHQDWRTWYVCCWAWTNQ